MAFDVSQYIEQMIFNVWTTEHILTRFLKDGLDYCLSIFC